MGETHQPESSVRARLVEMARDLGKFATAIPDTIRSAARHDAIAALGVVIANAKTPLPRSLVSVACGVFEELPENARAHLLVVGSEHIPLEVFARGLRDEAMSVRLSAASEAKLGRGELAAAATHVLHSRLISTEHAANAVQAALAAGKVTEELAALAACAARGETVDRELDMRADLEHFRATPNRTRESDIEGLTRGVWDLTGARSRPFWATDILARIAGELTAPGCDSAFALYAAALTKSPAGVEPSFPACVYVRSENGLHGFLDDFLDPLGVLARSLPKEPRARWCFETALGILPSITAEKNPRLVRQLTDLYRELADGSARPVEKIVADKESLLASEGRRGRLSEVPD
jgi:hypothetical protein